MNSPAAQRLGTYAAQLAYDELPADVLRLAKTCLIDTVAAIIYGSDAPASRIAAAYSDNGRAGQSSILGGSGPKVRAEAAAFANGVAAHALELDSLRQPGAGVHPGAVLVPVALASAQERGASGRDVLAAIVAGCEVLFRIGRATKHSAEARGFHAPCLTGPFGAAVVAGRLLALDAAEMTQALGIAGSLSGGLLAFAASGDGAMVKRLHLGRAAENGIMAARLASLGFTGPRTVLDGRFGFLDAFCPERDDAALIAGLGEDYETRTICFKRYACHITAHTPVFAIEALKAAGAIGGTEVTQVEVAGTEKMMAMHARADPADLVMAQYSIPFCIAVALLRDPTDPDSFGDAALADPAVRDLCQRVRVTRTPGGKGWATTTRLILTSGQVIERAVSDFPGTPQMPLDAAAVGEKFCRLTRRLGALAEPLLRRLENIEAEDHLDWLADAIPSHALMGDHA